VDSSDLLVRLPVIGNSVCLLLVVDRIRGLLLLLIPSVRRLLVVDRVRLLAGRGGGLVGRVLVRGRVVRLLRVGRLLLVLLLGLHLERSVADGGLVADGAGVSSYRRLAVVEEGHD
jgi:hypothetical protein